ncbi:acetyltransferase [Paraburkholderia solisilvae]|uniref:Acetyltransferase EpsM n=1 Tax=Paraburkholderia solisilvae TaxID=624376 RepID=A0A6J5ESX8_9BURK|nr:acetyltransferase [Paraburkholderia solisilvae]CAB3768105.1 Putative acetyltransferase EpsM [Paraburkholderia solisilvae]
MSRQHIIFWGATGQAKVLRELTRDDFDLQAVFDNSPDVPPPFVDVPLLRKWEGFTGWRAARQSGAPLHFLVAIGGDRGKARLELHRMLEQAGLIPAVALHRTAFVAHNAKIGDGSQILANAAVCVEAELGKSCIVNTSASVDHECRLGDGVHIAPGARLAGAVEVGPCSMIGTGAVVLPRVKIGSHCVVGAGAIVTRDLPDGAVAYGAPAKVKRVVE